MSLKYYKEKMLPVTA